MGKRIIQRARGKGSLSYRSNPKAYRITVSYPSEQGEGEIIKLLNVSCYSAPVVKVLINHHVFYSIAARGVYEGQKIAIGQGAIVAGNILPLKDIPVGTNVFNLETIPGKGPRLARTGGAVAYVTKKEHGVVYVMLPSKQERAFHPEARSTIGAAAAAGRLEKPILKAGKMVHMTKARGARIYPRTSAVKMNVIDHPFGSGRGKRIKSKIAKRWAPPGRKVGLLRPRHVGGRR
jgi:large subunit ribosomal protein L2